jgi:hypothetical protein
VGHITYQSMQMISSGFGGCRVLAFFERRRGLVSVLSCGSSSLLIEARLDDEPIPFERSSLAILSFRPF